MAEKKSLEDAELPPAKKQKTSNEPNESNTPNKPEARKTAPVKPLSAKKHAYLFNSDASLKKGFLVSCNRGAKAITNILEILNKVRYQF